MAKNGDLVRIKFKCVGTSPHLQHRPQPDVLERIRTKEKAPKNAPPVGTPREEAEQYVHQLEGKPYIPKTMLFAVLCGAGVHVRLDGKRQVSTATSTMLPAFIELPDKLYWLVHPETGEPATWEPDVQPGKNKTGDMIALCRPRFDEWAFSGEVVVDTREIGVNKIRDLFDIAGKRIGVGSFRPNRKGFYGMFRVDRWDQV